MDKYYMKITFQSDTIIGSGEGFGTVIDTDVIFDDLGIPYIPAKRIKGILLDSAHMLNEMFTNSKIDNIIPISKIFGEKGKSAGNLYIDNFYIKDYEKVKVWLSYLKQEFNIINKENILNQFTSIRHSTAIDNITKMAKEHSLRTERVINKGLVFIAEINMDENYKDSIVLICQNIRRIGTKRSRGFGEVDVKLWDNNNIITFDIKSLKEVSNEIN